MLVHFSLPGPLHKSFKKGAHNLKGKTSGGESNWRFGGLDGGLMNRVPWDRRNLIAEGPHCPGSEGVLQNTVKASSMLLHIASMRLFPHKDIGVASSLNDLFLKCACRFQVHLN
jgi:hypothetical protein